jgi:ABC-2 type transport system permease protein
VTEAPGPRAQLDRRLPVGRALLAQTGMELRLLVRSPESLLVTFGIPLGLLVFFSSVEVLPTGDRGGVDFLVPGVLAISVAATGLVAVSIQTAFERKYGVLKRLGGTPLPRVGFLAAKGLAVGALLLLQTAATLALAAGPLGWRPSGGLLLAALIVGVGAVTHTALGLLLAGALRAEATLALSNALFLVLLVVSGVSFDAEVLPDALAAAGRVLPVGALAEALRAALEGGSPWGSLALVAAWGVAAVALAARTFRWEP